MTLQDSRLFSRVMDERSKRDLAWIGDAVLGLYAREWLLREPDRPPCSRQERYIRFTSNAFLSGFGEPTEVEARIGKIYKETGLTSAFEFIEEELLPRFKLHMDKVARSSRGMKNRRN